MSCTDGAAATPDGAADDGGPWPQPGHRTLRPRRVLRDDSPLWDCADPPPVYLYLNDAGKAMMSVPRDSDLARAVLARKAQAANAPQAHAQQ